MAMLTQKNCMHVYYVYASELCKDHSGMVKIWKKCKKCFREFTYLRKAKP